MTVEERRCANGAGIMLSLVSKRQFKVERRALCRRHNGCWVIWWAGSEDRRACRDCSAHLLGIACHFFLWLEDAVILEVLIKSPMYFCKNLLLLSSLSCSSFTASMRLKMVRRES